MTEHEEKKKFHCDMCGKDFDTEVEFEKHKKEHHS